MIKQKIISWLANSGFVHQRDLPEKNSTPPGGCLIGGSQTAPLRYGSISAGNRSRFSTSQHSSITSLSCF
jgi:hypothetical protein